MRHQNNGNQLSNFLTLPVINWVPVSRAGPQVLCLLFVFDQSWAVSEVAQIYFASR